MIDNQRDRTPSWPIKPKYRSELFSGTAEFYEKYRLTYPMSFLNDILDRVGIDHGGLLLDLAAGTGQVARPLASKFERVIAVDQEPQMVQVGSREAAASGLDNISWVVGRCENITIEAGSCDLITVGNAFHRLDRFAVAEKAKNWLKSSKYFVVLGCGSIYSGTETWQEVLQNIVRRWKEPEANEEEATGEPAPKLTHQDVLVQLGYREVREFTLTIPHERTLDDIIGYVKSLSGLSPTALGERASMMENDIRRELKSRFDTDRFEENPEYFFILARNPN